VEVEEGQVIGMLEGHLVAAGEDHEATLQDVLQKADMNKAEVITLYFGADLTGMQANQIADRIREQWPALEVELLEGGQPHYQLIVAIE
jgi:dihydroxyacetone kinase-like predicted kinase